MPRFYLLIAYIFSCATVYAQKDTLFNVYPFLASSSSRIEEAISLSNGQYCFVQRYPEPLYNYPLIIVTNSKGEALYTLELSNLDGFTIVTCTAFFELGNELIFICNGNKDGKYYELAIATTKELVPIQVVDSIKLSQNSLLYFNVFKYNVTKNLYEGIGVNYLDGKLAENCYLSFNPDSKKLDYHSINGLKNQEHILDFIYHPEKKVYLLTSFYEGNWVISESFNFVNYSILFHKYVYNNITYYGNYQPQNFALLPNGRVVAFGKMFAETPYAYSMIEFDLPLGKDTADIYNIAPLNNPPTPPLAIWLGATMKVDNKGNYIITGTGTSDLTNTSQITVVKYDAAYNKIWQLKYTDPGRSYLIWDLEIDSNNDIVLVGEVYNYFRDNTTTGFLMKIYENGQLTVSDHTPGTAVPGISIFPNPTAGRIYILGSDPGKTLRLRLFNALGELVSESMAERGGLDIGFLPAGVYVAQVLEGERVLVSKRLVKL